MNELYMWKFSKYWIAGLVFIYNISTAQNIFDNVDSLTLHKDYHNAIIGLERQIFFTNMTTPNDTSTLDSLYIQTAHCHRALKEYDKAYLALSYVKHSDTNLAYQKLFLSYMANDFATTELEYNAQQMKNVKDSRANTLYLLSLHELGKWQEAKKNLLSDSFQLSNTFDSSRRESILHLYDTPLKLKKKSTAEALNTFIPGAGYLYLGKRKDAFTLMGLQLFSLGITAGLAYNKLYFTGGAIGLGLFEKFRRGSVAKVALLTEDVNNMRKYKYNQRLKKFILE